MYMRVAKSPFVISFNIREIYFMVMLVMWIAPVKCPVSSGILHMACTHMDLPDTLIAFLELECLQTIMVLHCSLHLPQLITAALPCSLLLVISECAVLCERRQALLTGNLLDLKHPSQAMVSVWVTQN